MKDNRHCSHFPWTAGGVLSAFVLVFIQAITAYGAAPNWNWVGSTLGGDGFSYEDSLNWDIGSVPLSRPNTYLHFGNDANQTESFVWLTGNKLVGGVMFDPHPNVDPYVIFGDDILSLFPTNVGNVGLLNNDATAVDFSIRLRLMNSQTWAANAGAMNMNSEVNLFNRALTINGAAPVTIAGNVVGGGLSSIIQAGTGLLTLSGNNSFAGGVTVNSGRTVALGSDSGAGASAITINGGTLTTVGGSRHVANDIRGSAANVNVPVGSILSLSGALSAPDLQKTGLGELELSGNFNSFSTMTIASGRVSLTGTGGDIIPNTARVVLDSGTLDLRNRTETFGTLEVSLNGGSLLLQPDANHASLTLDDLTLNGVLVIEGWLGTVMTPGDDDRIYLNNYTGDIEELEHLIYFDGFGWGGLRIGNELVPIPEPGTGLLLALGGGLFVLVRWLRRRRR